MLVGVLPCAMPLVILFSLRRQSSQDSDVAYKRKAKAYDINSPAATYSDLPLYDENDSDSSLLPQDIVDSDNLLSTHSDSPVGSKEQEKITTNAEETLFLFEAKLAKAIGMPVGEKSGPRVFG